MGDSVRSANMFDALLQPSKGKADSTEKAPAKSAAAKAKKAEAAKTAPPQVKKDAPLRTGNKRGGLANKGTRPQRPQSGTDNRGKRTYDRVSELDFQKGHGGARKGGMNYGGNADIRAEAVAATEDHNAGAKDAAAENKDGVAATDDKKVEVKKEEPDHRKTLAQFEAEQAAKAVKGDIKETRAVVVGKEFKTGTAPKKNKHDKEPLFADIQAAAEKKRAEESAKDSKPVKKGKETKAAPKEPAAKPQKIVIDQFNDTVKAVQPERRPEPVAEVAKTDAPKASTGGAPRGGRGGRGGARGGRGGRGGAGRRVNLDLEASFPPLSPTATKA